mgnify:CR=1 FL=1
MGTEALIAVPVADYSVDSQSWQDAPTHSAMDGHGGCQIIEDCLLRVPLDAIPDLSDTQVIVYSRWDRSPDIMEDQVTYPITSALLGMPKVKDIRGFSDFGYSYVYIIFEEGTDIYWARAQVNERTAQRTLAERQAERQAVPELLPVAADRLGDQLPDGALGGRERDRQLSHGALPAAVAPSGTGARARRRPAIVRGRAR